MNHGLCLEFAVQLLLECVCEYILYTPITLRFDMIRNSMRGANMNVNYPNGKRYKPVDLATDINRKNKKNSSYSNRGMTLEEDLNETNEYYRDRKIAVIHKKPTPVQIVQVDYPNRSAAVIKEAYFKLASTTDYNGVYQGKYIDF
jgi:recombination protein U